MDVRAQTGKRVVAGRHDSHDQMDEGGPMASPLADKVLVLAGPTLDRVLGMVRLGIVEATPVAISSFEPGRCVSSLRDLRSQDFSSLKRLGVVTATFPLHIMVPRRQEWHRMRGVVSHVGPARYPSGSFMQIAPNILVPTWPLYFLQKCRSLPTLSQRLKFGEELCGSYSHEIIADERTQCHFGRAGDHRRIRPVADAAGLLDYLAGARGMTGVRCAREAARRIVGNAASPMEAVLAQMLALSPREGGYGFANVQLNPRIEVPPEKRHLTKRDHFYPDAYLADIGDDLEYDSKQFHTDETRAQDAARRNDIQALGMRVVSVTSEMIMSFDELELVMRQVLDKAIVLQGEPARRRVRLLRDEEVRQRRRRRLHELLPQWRRDQIELGV